MTNTHVIVGAGPVGSELARLLAADGKSVAVVSRSGRGIAADSVTRITADASDPDRLTRIADGASVIYNCANPPAYTKWREWWPPLAESLLITAKQTGAVLAIAGTLYPYGPVDRPMVESMPDAAVDHKGVLRARIWADALAAHDAGQVRAVEVRGSDYAGAGVYSHLARLVPRAMDGKGVRVLGDPDVAHSWTDVRDMARALALVAETESAWGRVWHAPTNPPRSQREALHDVLAYAGTSDVSVKPLPMGAMRLLGGVVPFVGELMQMSYQFTRPYVLDSSAITERYGLAPTPWDEVCRRTAITRPQA